MKNWDDLRFCLALERYATMTAAADHLGTNVATVSRRIERITHEIGETLFVKDGQAWKPTSAAKSLIAIAEKTERRLSVNIAHPENRTDHVEIKVNGPLRVLQGYLSPVMGQISDEVENLTLTISLFRASLAYGETDIVLSNSEPLEGRLIRKKIRTTEWRSYCIKGFEDQLIGWGDAGDDIHDTVPDLSLHQYFGKPPHIRITGLNLMKTVMEKLPIACRLPHDFASMHPDLIELPIGGVNYSDIWISYHYTRRSDPVLRRVVDIISSYNTRN